MQFSGTLLEIADFLQLFYFIGNLTEKSAMMGGWWELSWTCMHKFFFTQISDLWRFLSWLLLWSGSRIIVAHTHTHTHRVIFEVLWSKFTPSFSLRLKTSRAAHESLAASVCCELADERRRCSEECNVQISLCKHGAKYRRRLSFFYRPSPLWSVPSVSHRRLSLLPPIEKHFHNHLKTPFTDCSGPR